MSCFVYGLGASCLARWTLKGSVAESSTCISFGKAARIICLGYRSKRYIRTINSVPLGTKKQSHAGHHKSSISLPIDKKAQLHTRLDEEIKGWSILAICKQRANRTYVVGSGEERSLLCDSGSMLRLL